jgi:hypothetical protein
MRTDAQLKDDVIEEVRWDPQISDADAIGVVVKDGAMILSRHVPSYAEKMAAAQAAERVNGVKAGRGPRHHEGRNRDERPGRYRLPGRGHSPARL